MRETHDCRLTEVVDEPNILGTLLLVLYVGFGPLRAQTRAGEAVFNARCATCHVSPSDRTPDVEALRARSAEQILSALSPGGSMTTQAAALTAAERQSVVAFLSASPASPAPPSNSRYQPNPGLSAADVPRLTACSLRPVACSL